MDPIILPNTGVPWIFLILGLILLLVGIVATMARRLEVRQRVGLVGTGIVVIVIGLMASKSRIELHDDKIVQRIQMILPKRTEIKLDGITEVAVVEYEESGKAKESWFFSRDKEAGPTIVATGLWKGHSETIIKFLREKGIKVTRQKSR